MIKTDSNPKINIPGRLFYDAKTNGAAPGI